MRRFICISFIYFIFLIFTGCKEDLTVQQKSNENVNLQKKAPVEKFQNPYAYMGRLHNEALDSTFSYIKNESKKIKTKDDILKISQKGIDQYFKNKNILVEEDYLYKSLEKIQSKEFQLVKLSLNPDYKSLGYSYRQIPFMKRLYCLMDKHLPISVMKDSIENINYQSFEILGELESVPILQTSSIMESSFEYHPTRGKDWYNLLANIMGKRLNKTTKEVNWEEVAQVDVIAMGGALFPCIGATIGWGACVLAAGTYSSLVDLLWQIIAILLD
jgi:hypothetical protein